MMSASKIASSSAMQNGLVSPGGGLSAKCSNQNIVFRQNQIKKMEIELKHEFWLPINTNMFPYICQASHNTVIKNCYIIEIMSTWKLARFDLNSHSLLQGIFSRGTYQRIPKYLVHHSLQTSMNILYHNEIIITAQEKNETASYSQILP